MPDMAPSTTYLSLQTGGGVETQDSRKNICFGQMQKRNQCSVTSSALTCSQNELCRPTCI